MTWSDVQKQSKHTVAERRRMRYKRGKSAAVEQGTGLG